MAAARRVVEADLFTRSGKFHAWGPQMFLGHDVYGKKLGIIGLGRIGRAVARRARGFAMEVIFHNTGSVPEEVARELGAKAVGLDELFRVSDFISLHVPLSPETTHMVNEKALRLMKPSCILINTSRGPVVDENALAAALRNRVIAGAALDVYEREPEIVRDLLELENVILAPHIASASHDTRLKMCNMAADNLIAALAGKRPPNLVNHEVWERTIE
jgi:glyoxylate reductase